MDLSTQTVRLCIAGTQAELRRDLETARSLYTQAWQVASDDYDRTIAAHYLGHLEPDLVETHRWNVLALSCAQRDPRTEPFLGSLLVSLGGTFEQLGQLEAAQRMFAQAADYGVIHTPPEEA